MARRELRWMLLCFVAICCLAVFGIWKVGELAFARLPAAVRFQVQQTRSAALRSADLAPLAEPPQANIGRLHETGFVRSAYDIKYRTPYRREDEGQFRAGYAIERDFYDCGWSSTTTVADDAMWKTFWSLEGGSRPTLDDSGPGLRIENLGEPMVWLQSMTLNLEAGHRAALRMRGKSSEPRRVEVHLQDAEGPMKTIARWPLELLAEADEWILVGPPNDRKREMLFSIHLGEQASAVEFDLLLPGTGAYRESTPRFGRHYIERRFNARGYRDRDYPPQPAPGTIRIGCIGDSFTEGAGVRLEETLPKQLEHLLAVERPTEVLNWGKCGSGLDHYAKRFARDVELRPHVVIVVLYRNDFETLQMRRRWSEQFAGDFNAYDRAQREYCLQQGFAEAFKHLDEIREACQARKIQLVLCAYQTENFPESFRLDQDARAYAEKHDLPYFNPAADLASANLFELAAQCSECEPHPSAAVHQLVAERLARFLEDEGVLAAASAAAAAP